MSEHGHPGASGLTEKPDRLPRIFGGWCRAVGGSWSWGHTVVWVLIAAYIIFFGVATVQKHNAFRSTAYDLGNVDQAVWNTRHGRPFAMTNIEGLSNRLGTHVELILLPISLLYFVWSDPRALLLLQTFVIALGAWPVYLLARRAMGQSIPVDGPDTRRSSPITPRVSRFALEALPLTFAFAYLLFPALQSANMFDFHAVALAPTFWLFALYCLETECWAGFALFSVLTMSCKEDMPLLVAMLGLYALLARRKWRIGLLTVGLAAAWFLVAVGWVMPHFDTQEVSPFTNRYAYLGTDPAEMALTLLTRPGVVLEHLLTVDNLVYLRDLFTPVVFLSLLAPQVLVLAVPSLAVNLLSTDGFMHRLEDFHYGVPLVPIVVVAAAYGAAWLTRRFARFRRLPILVAALVLAATLFYHRSHGYTPLAVDFGLNWPAVSGHQRLGQEMGRRIPADASLAALPFPNPHASQRQRLSMIDRVENSLPAPLHGADYVWLDVTNSWPLHPNDLKVGIENLLAGEYGVDQAVDGWLLLRRGAPDKALPDAFYDFARTSDPRPSYPMKLQFLLDGEPVLECLGFDLDWQADGAQLTFYWQALGSLPADLRVYPFYLDDATGQMLEDTTLRPMIATVWYPPERWRVGEVVASRTLPWEVVPDFSVGLGVVRGDDWNGVDQRLPIRVESSESVIRLFDGDTWGRLLRVEDRQSIEEYRVFRSPSPQYPLDADFGDKIRLLGYDLDCDRRQARCDLRPYWQAQTRLEISYSIFAQMLGPAGNVRAQVDSVPQGGGYPTVWWLPGEVVADTLTLELPLDAPRNVAYRLIVGLYDPASGLRLPVVGTGADFLELTTIEP
jgi:uncharacterized membrane protein